MSYTGKNVLITGGTTGIGLEIIKQLLERGAAVSLLNKNKFKINNRFVLECSSFGSCQH